MDPKPVSSTRNPITTIRMQCTRNYSLRLQESRWKINVLRLFRIPIHSFSFKRNARRLSVKQKPFKRNVLHRKILHDKFDTSKKILNLFKMKFNNFLNINRNN